MTGHRPERLVTGRFDPVDRAAAMELDGLTSPDVEISIAVWIGEQVGHRRVLCTAWWPQLLMRS
jgi:hypothetical protein